MNCFLCNAPLLAANTVNKYGGVVHGFWHPKESQCHGSELNGKPASVWYRAEQACGTLFTFVEEQKNEQGTAHN